MSSEVVAAPTTDGTQPQQRGGFGRGGDRKPRDGGDRKPRGDRKPKDSEEGAWVPVTKLGRLVLAGKVKQLEEAYLFSLPIKEYQIVDHFLGSKLVDEVMKIMPVQKMTAAGQRTRFKAFCAVGDNDGHIGLGVKCSAEVATAIRGASILAKISVVPVRRGYWGSNSGLPHTLPCKVSGKCGSVSVRLIPAPRGTGLVSSPTMSRFLTMAGISDCYSSSTGKTRTTGNMLKACYNALRETYGYLSPDLWPVTIPGRSPIQEHSEFLEKGKQQREQSARGAGRSSGAGRPQQKRV